MSKEFLENIKFKVENFSHDDVVSTGLGIDIGLRVPICRSYGLEWMATWSFDVDYMHMKAESRRDEILVNL